MRQNIIGRHARVEQSENKELIGISGTITDETKNTITIDDQRVLPKQNITFIINGQQHTITTKKPSDRIKK